MKVIKNVRPGILVIGDAKLRLGPGEQREVESLTREMEQALEAGLLVEPKTGRGRRKRAGREDEAGDLGRLSAADAIEKIQEETDPEVLVGQIENEKRKGVLDALNARLEEVRAESG
jgi:hypothetical protein